MSGTIFFSRGGFVENRGSATVLPMTRGNAGSILAVEGWGGFEGFKAIFTRVQFGEQTRHQFSNNLGSWIYLYVFGYGIGTLNLGGLAFYDNCIAGGSNRIGMSNVDQFFRAYNLVERAYPLKITIDPVTTFQAYLHSVQGDVVDPAARLYQFNLGLSLVPKEVRRSQAGDAVAAAAATAAAGNPGLQTPSTLNNNLGSDAEINAIYTDLFGV